MKYALDFNSRQNQIGFHQVFDTSDAVNTDDSSLSPSSQEINDLLMISYMTISALQLQP